MYQYQLSIKCFSANGEFDGELSGPNIIGQWRAYHAADLFADGGHVEIWTDGLRPNDWPIEDTATLDRLLTTCPACGRVGCGEYCLTESLLPAHCQP